MGALNTTQIAVIVSVVVLFALANLPVIVFVLAHLPEILKQLIPKKMRPQTSNGTDTSNQPAPAPEPGRVQAMQGAAAFIQALEREGAMNADNAKSLTIYDGFSFLRSKCMPFPVSIKGDSNNG